MKRYIVKIAYPIVRIYWFLARPRIAASKCVIWYGDEFLMVRHTYGRGGAWTFPGGGIKRKETPEAAARREIKEEVGVVISEIKNIGSFFTDVEYSRCTVHCFSARATNKELHVGADEIAEAKWFSKHNSPAHLTPYAQKILEFCKKQNPQ